MKIALFLVGFMGLLQGGMSNTQITPTLNATQFRGITFLDQKILSYNIIDGLKFSEISDLAYNKTEK
ncbi:MAG: esterase-like activity of phytase family protein, partial [Sulfurovum sp.]|nr:esterase-like activity of phytase family protein [Sulfurovum sp.]NNJ46133.1 esterase-like activity of phytase family protein [Sulfurovum sp.]